MTLVNMKIMPFIQSKQSALHDVTRSSAVADRLHDASCH